MHVVCPSHLLLHPPSSWLCLTSLCLQSPLLCSGMNRRLLSPSVGLSCGNSTTLTAGGPGCFVLLTCPSMSQTLLTIHSLHFLTCTNYCCTVFLSCLVHWVLHLLLQWQPPHDQHSPHKSVFSFIFNCCHHKILEGLPPLQSSPPSSTSSAIPCSSAAPLPASSMWHCVPTCWLLQVWMPC